ncbi:MAG: cytochrome c [Pseudomonadota bacterium]|nr:cytochrome c [Pseudomonadota bacterium]
MKNTNQALVAFAALLLATAADAGDVEAGKKKAAEVCAACHGPDGNSPAPDFPKLAGQHADYMVSTLKKYKNGKRANPIMMGMAAMLSDQDMQNVAAYYAAQKGLELKY